MPEVSGQEALESAGLDNPPSAQGLNKGDLVVMHSCVESEYHYGKVWTCRDDSFIPEGCIGDRVFLVGFSGTFRCAKLQLIKSDIGESEKAEQQLTGYMLARQGGDVEELVCSMGLEQEEWAGIKESCSWIPVDISSDIDQYFNEMA